MTRSHFFRAFAVGILTAAAQRLLGQTKVATRQHYAEGTGRVWVNYQDRLRHAVIENAELIEVGNDLHFRAVPVAPTFRREQRIVSTAGEVFGLAAVPVPGSLSVSDNGLNQWEGEEFTLDGQSVTMPFTEAGSWVIFHYAEAGGQ